MKRVRRMAMVGMLCGLTLGSAVGVSWPRVAGAAQQQLVDVNAATAEELAALPGIGPAKAEAIVEYRAKQRFSTVEELMQVQGVGPKLFEQLKGYITVGAASVSGDPASKVR